MSHRAAAWLAWVLWVMSLSLLMAGLTVTYLHRSATPASEDFPLLLEILFVVGFASYPTVGALVASRRPKNIVGWLLCCVGLAVAASVFTEDYATYARAGSLSGAEAAAFLASINPGVTLSIFVVLLFPDGRLPSRRWRPVVWLAGAQVTLAGMLSFLNSRGTGSLEVASYFGIFSILSVLNEVLIVGVLIGVVASVAFRLRRARGDERQQIKWFVYAVSVIAAGGLASTFLPSPLDGVFWVVTVFGMAALPVAVGIAILKHRLYDIDIIINRTLVYASLTVLLATTYFAGVVGLQYVLRAVTGQGSQLAVVASTLAIAALFSPLRRLVQGFVDRRFYRRKYDAGRILDAFNARLRDETQLDTLSEDLVGVVTRAVQPAHASLWLRPETGSKREQAD